MDSVFMFQSVCCQHVLGTRAGKRKADGTVCLGRLVKGVYIKRSRRKHASLPQSLIVLCHPWCISQAAWVRRSRDVLPYKLPFTQCAFPSCLSTKLSRKWHPSLTRNRLPAGMHHSVSQSCLSVCLATAPGSQSMSCQTSRPHQRAKLSSQISCCWWNLVWQCG